MPEGDSLENHLSEATYSELESFITGLGAPMQNFARFEPWLMSSIVTLMKGQQAGFNPAAGVEATITGLAQARRIDIDGLETAEFQVKMFDGMSADLQVEGLEQALGTDDLVEVMELLTTAWTKGDLETLDEYFTAEYDEYPEVSAKILDERNANWVPQLQAMLDQPGDYLVVVGVGHMIGDKSVPNLMDAAGTPLTRTN